MAPALKELKRLGHRVDPVVAKRYVHGDSSVRWKTREGGAPREGAHWKHGPGAGRGAGSRRGPLLVRKFFLKDVWMRDFRG